MATAHHFKDIRAGFTLVELSVVVVIISLVIGGVLVGRDMITQSRLRGTLSQLDQFQSATSSFSTKYGCLPGDCPNAVDLKLSTVNGNGDGIIGGYCEVWANAACPTGFVTNLYVGSYAGIPNESVYYWSELQGAGFISVQLQTQYYPQVQTPLKHGYWWVLQSEANITKISVNSFRIAEEYGGDYVTAKANCGDETNCPSLSPAEAFYLDQKIDDGLPLSGSVQANNAFSYPQEFWQAGLALIKQGSPGASSAVCVDNTVTPRLYNMQNTTTNLCLPTFAAKF